MNKTGMEELRALSVAELQDKIEASRRELLDGRFAQVTEGNRLGSKARVTRRNIARMLTIINQKKAEAQA